MAAESVRPYTLQQTWAAKYSIRVGPWKYIDHQGSGGNDYHKWEGLDAYLLPDTAPDAPGQLYDLENDPGETTNLYFQHPERVRRMKALLDHSIASGRSAPRRNADAAPKPPPKPNIILIMADDLGYAGLGCYGQELIQTPEIDKMAAEGMRFTSFYAGNAACVPSRVSLLLGMHPGRAPIRDNLMPHLPGFAGYMRNYPAELWPPGKLPTLGRVMKDAGYQTAQFGKLEAGIPMAAGRMTAHGWDHWFGFKGTGAPFSSTRSKCGRTTGASNSPKTVPTASAARESSAIAGPTRRNCSWRKSWGSSATTRTAPFFIYFPTQIPHGRSPADGDEIQLPGHRPVRRPGMDSARKTLRRVRLPSRFRYRPDHQGVESAGPRPKHPPPAHQRQRR
jgi:arylsulfatase A-like enzyme